MKRLDLIAGTDYLASAYNDWRTGKQPTHQVRVLDNGWWTEEHNWSMGERQVRTLQLPDGSTRTTTRDIKAGKDTGLGDVGVLVEYVGESFFHKDGEVAIMAPGHIRGEYAEAQALADANGKAAQARAANEAAGWKADRQALEQVMDQLGTVYGIKATLGAYPYSRDLVLDAANAQHLLDLLLDTGASLVDERDQLQAQVRQLEAKLLEAGTWWSTAPAGTACGKCGSTVDVEVSTHRARCHDCLAGI
jgi:hypothetical protein